jgi:hypothetical protein
VLDGRALYAQPRLITRVEDCFFYHVVELGDEWDLVPHHGLPIDDMRAGQLPVLERMRNSFWLTHRLSGSRARVH